MPHHGQYQHVKEWLQDHDTDVVNEAPPVQNTWYEAFDAEDVRLLWCLIFQSNDETAAKDVEVRWIIDGTTYFVSTSLINNSNHHIFRYYLPSAAGTDGLLVSAAPRSAVHYMDKRGLDFKVEIRMTSVPGTNQILRGWCVRETLEVT